MREGRSFQRRCVFDSPTILAKIQYHSTSVRKNYKAVFTCRRDCQIKECKKDSFHHVETIDANERLKMARFEQLIIAVKEVTHQEGSGKSPYVIAHISFQSTGSTNIQCANALSEVMIYVRQRNRGRRDAKQVYGVLK